LDPFGKDPNAEVDWSRVRRYVAISERLPVEVLELGGELLLVDGYHRFVARQLGGKRTIGVTWVTMDDMPLHRVEAVKEFLAYRSKRARAAVEKRA